MALRQVNRAFASFTAIEPLVHIDVSEESGGWGGTSADYYSSVGL